jgi:ketosteroid isomerase-like protein
MNRTVEAQIVDAEDRLRTAMLRSDVIALDELLAPELIFTNHLGRLMGKEDDLAAHRSGMLKVNELRPSEQHVRVNGDMAIVSVRVRLSGTYDGHPANADLRFTRVWAVSPHQTWQVVAAHATMVA